MELVGNPKRGRWNRPRCAMLSDTKLYKSTMDQKTEDWRARALHALQFFVLFNMLECAGIHNELTWSKITNSNAIPLNSIFQACH